jgi:adenine phosphoribosyltransferase
VSTGRGLRSRLKEAFEWNAAGGANPARWWLDPDIRSGLVTALAGLHADQPIDAVVAVPTRGFILGPLVAAELGVGFAEIQKDARGDLHGKALLRRATPPDYAQRDLTLTLRRGLLTPRARVVLVDDWIETGAQATAAARLVEDAGAVFAGVAVVVDATTAAVRRDLAVRSLLSIAEL